MERQVSLRLPTPLLAELEKRARKHGLTRAAMIRAALDAYVALPDGALEESPYERVAGLAGSIEGLPADMASNPSTYMSDFGARNRRR